MSFIYQIVIGIVLVVIQVVGSNLLGIGGASPDLALIFLVWIIIQRGQLTGELVGFLLGLSIDILSSGAPGTKALSMAVTGFLLGYFYSSEEMEHRLRNWPFLLFVGAGAIINNVTYYLLTLANTNFMEYVLNRGGISALYTVVLAVIPMYYFSRKPLY